MFNDNDNDMLAIAPVGPWDVIGRTCEMLEAQRIERQAQERAVTFETDRYRVVHEIPRKHTDNGYAFDV